MTAFQAFHEADKASWTMGRISRKVDQLKDEIDFKIRQHYAAQLAVDNAFKRMLHNFYGHCLNDWLATCGNDGRMKRLPSEVGGWENLKVIIIKVRRETGIYR